MVGMLACVLLVPSILSLAILVLVCVGALVPQKYFERNKIIYLAAGYFFIYLAGQYIYNIPHGVISVSLTV